MARSISDSGLLERPAVDVAREAPARTRAYVGMSDRSSSWLVAFTRTGGSTFDVSVTVGIGDADAPGSRRIVARARGRVRRIRIRQCDLWLGFSPAITVRNPETGAFETVAVPGDGCAFTAESRAEAARRAARCVLAQEDRWAPDIR